jgi:hypothetical protein
MLKKILLYSIPFVLVATYSWATATTAKMPSAGSTTSESPWSVETWSNPTNIYADDTIYASVTAATYDTLDLTYVLKGKGYGFAVPSGSTIDGVFVRVNTWYGAGTGASKMNLCQLLDTSGAKVGTNKCSGLVTLTTNNTNVFTYGGPSDNWGNSLTSAWVNHSNFGVAVGDTATVDNSDVYVDYIEMTVYYRSPAETFSGLMMQVTNE